MAEQVRSVESWAGAIRHKPRLHRDGGPVHYYGLMLPREDPEFKALVNGVLKAQMASGTFAKLYERWFLTPIPPAGQNLDLPMSETLQFRVKNPSDALKP